MSLAERRSNRTIEPFALINTQENWVLIAYCQLRKDFRAFRLDCIESLVVTSQKFEAHQMTLEEYFEAASKKWAASQNEVS